MRDFDDLLTFRKYFLWASTIGTLVGFATAWKEKVGLAILSAWGGVCIVLILQESLLFRLEA